MLIQLAAAGLFLVNASSLPARTLNGPGPVPLTVAATVRASHEPHPAIRAAIRSLEAAKRDLQHAAHDFGGHRADALAAVDAAINQLRIALQYDK
jgi:ABC-type proline/glycine betaine transport system permease subunit